MPILTLFPTRWIMIVAYSIYVDYVLTRYNKL